MSKYEYIPEPALVKGDHDFASLTRLVTDINLRPTPKAWYLAMMAANALLMVLLGSIGYLIWEGIGIWGLNNPVGWGWAIINFVWWVGIGHAGTLISAVLFLFRQDWRTAINRFAEAMTIFAVMCALIFPGIHVGRIWVIYWVFPIPNQMSMWPNFNSPLLWDVFAVSTYFTVSFLFWYVGLVPDLATIRDRAVDKVRKVAYGIFSLGWTGSNRHWWNYEKSYMILAGLATPLVLSVHTIVSLMIVTRKIFGMKDIMTDDHMEKMNIIILVTGSMVGFAYMMEFFIAWYSGVEYEKAIFIKRAVGPYAWAYWTMMLCNVISPQVFWFKKLRRSVGFTFFISIVVNIGMWFERFVITVTSLANDYLPSSWDYYSPTLWDILTYVGTFGLFFTMFLLFLRFLPMVALAEIKAILPQADPHNYDDVTKEYHAPKVAVPKPQLAKKV